MNQIGATAGQLSEQGLYWILSALILLLAAILLGFATGKFRFAREVESIKEQLVVANTLLESYDTDDTKKTREALEKINEGMAKITEEQRATRETITRLNERQEQYDRERWNFRSAGGGGNSV